MIATEATAASQTDVVTDIGLQHGMFADVKASGPLNAVTNDKTAADGEKSWLPDLIATKKAHASKSDRIRQYDRLMKRDQKIIDLKRQLLYGKYPQGSPTLDAEGKPVPLGDYGGKPIDAGNHAPPNGIVRDMEDADALIALKKKAVADAKAASKKSDPDKDERGPFELGRLLIQRQNNANGLRRKILYRREIDEQRLAFLLIDESIKRLPNRFQFQRIHQGFSGEFDDGIAMLLAFGEK